MIGNSHTQQKSFNEICNLLTCRTVSRHELFPIRAPLMALEHCIAPFLDGCDADNNHRITLQEWAKCLEIDEVIISLFIYIL